MSNEIETIIEREFAALGFKIIHFNSPKEANGVDCWVQKRDKKPLSVEIKKLRKKQDNTYQVEPVCKNRRDDDLIAIIMNSEYVLIEPMKDHLKNCSKQGTRNFTLMF